MNKIMHPIEPEEIMAYLDGELATDRAAATATHLGQCAECQGLVAELRNVSQSLKTWEVKPSESETPPAIATALAEDRPKTREFHPAYRRSWRQVLGRRWPVVAWLGAGAAIALLWAGPLTFRENKMSSPTRPGIPVDSAVVGSAPAGDQLAMRLQPPATPTAKRAETVILIAPDEKKPAGSHELAANGPMIIRTAQLSLITKEFDRARANLEAILKRHRGYVGELKAGGATGSGRTLTATLRVPADQLDATLTEVKTLGRVESESQSGQDVTSQYVDLQARLANARNTEQRLTDLLRNRTGKLSDVLEVEQELDRVRGEIEQMEAERKNMTNQVNFATLNATITEDYQAQLQVVPPSTATRLSNAAIEGYRSMADGVLSLALFLLSAGPSLLLWSAILFMPARMIWKRVRRSFAS